MDTCYPFQTYPCEWGIAFLWSLTGRIVRFDILLLALMLVYVLVIGCRGSYLYYFGRYKSGRFLRQATNLLRTNSFGEVIAISGQYTKSPIAVMMAAGLSAFVLESSNLPLSESIDLASHAFGRSRVRTIQRLKFGMGTLRSIGSTAPLLGLGGTCFGLLYAFRGGAMEAHAFIAMTVTLTVLALIPAAAGLIVAVPALAVYDDLQMRIDSIDAEMRIAALEAISYLASSVRLLDADEARREYRVDMPPRLIRKFALQKRFSELLALPLAAVFGLVVVAFTVVTHPLAKGLHVRLGPDEAAMHDAAVEHVAIRVLEQNTAGSRAVYVNAKKTQLNDLDGMLRSEVRLGAKATAYVQVEDNVPWADVANAIDTLEGLHANVVLLPIPPDVRISHKHRSAKSRD